MTRIVCIEGDLTPELPGIEAIRVRGVYSDYEHDEIASNVVGQTYRNEEFDARNALDREVSEATDSIRQRRAEHVERLAAMLGAQRARARVSAFD